MTQMIIIFPFVNTLLFFASLNFLTWSPFSTKDCRYFSWNRK